MSRVGRLPVILPKGVTFTHKDQVITVKGPKGQLSQKIADNFEVNSGENNSLQFTRPSDAKQDRSLHGLYRALLQNMVIGVSEGFEKTLELVGVGYRAEAKGQILELSLGFSHSTVFVLPPEVGVTTEQVKGQNPKIILKCIDKQLLGLVAAKIRSIRPPEPYKGKGVRFSGEVIRRKAGKAAGKGKK